MYNFIFILEIIIIIFYIDLKYGTSDYKYIQESKADYSAYYYIDVVDNEILNLKEVPDDIKPEVWKASPIQQEVLDHFPNMIAMNEIYNDRVEDDGIFKSEFLNHMIKLQDAYIAGEIDEKKFEELFFSPNFKN